VKINIIEKIIGSGLFTGYIPFASGTFGSLAALCIYLIPGFENKYVLIPIIVIVSVAGIFIGNKFESAYGKDPKQCTIDEFAGTWISFLLIPKEPIIIITVFIIWRIFDIIKIYPANSAEKLEGGLGIMLDDIIAGLYSMVLGYILTLVFY
jgi:phosphatidylglycerophosphatase A